eukprot:991744-Pelagomonas_calceolata.AAC.4
MEDVSRTSGTSQREPAASLITKMQLKARATEFDHTEFDHTEFDHKDATEGASYRRAPIMNQNSEMH